VEGQEKASRHSNIMYRVLQYVSLSMFPLMMIVMSDTAVTWNHYGRHDADGRDGAGREAQNTRANIGGGGNGPCQDSPCRNGGTCLFRPFQRSGLPAYSCHCARGWAGLQCNVDLDECASFPCQNEGVCKESSSDPNVPNGQFICECVEGWTGNTCTNDVDECASTPCPDGGRCADSTTDPAIKVDGYMCTCEHGTWRD
jgi:hypothetical protein